MIKFDKILNGDFGHVFKWAQCSQQWSEHLFYATVLVGQQTLPVDSPLPEPCSLVERSM